MWQFFYCATCHNLGPSLTIIMDNGDQYFQKNDLCPKQFIVLCVRFLWMDDN